MDQRNIGADLLKMPEQAVLPFPMKMEEEEITEAEIEEIERAKEEQKKTGTEMAGGKLRA
jgi:hypothetical protein